MFEKYIDIRIHVRYYIKRTAVRNICLGIVLNFKYQIKECFTMSTFYNFEKFLTCEGNLIAFNAAKAVANSPTTAFNPLYIYGGHGTGKTHLLKAIKSAISESYSKMNVLYVNKDIIF